MKKNALKNHVFLLNLVTKQKHWVGFGSITATYCNLRTFSLTDFAFKMMPHYFKK